MSADKLVGLGSLLDRGMLLFGASADHQPTSALPWTDRIATPSLNVLLTAAGILAAVALLLGTQALWSGRVKTIPLRRAVASVLSVLWAVPVLVMLAVLGFYTAASLEPSGAAPATEPALMVSEEGVSPTELPGGADNRSSAGQPSNSKSRPSAESDAAESTAERTQPVVERGAKPPSWTTTPVSTVGDSQRVVVASGFYATEEEARAEAARKALEALKEDFERERNQAGPWSIPAEFLREHALRRSYVEAVPHDFGPVKAMRYRAFFQVELSPRVRDRLQPIWREQIVSRRLRAIGLLLGFVTLMLATGAAYFRLDELTQGAYRGRLKLAAVSLTLAGGLVAWALLPSVQA